MLNSMTCGGLEETFKRIAVQFIPNKDKVEQQVLNLAKKHPITYLFTKKLQDYSGRPVATIGGIENDFEGNTIHQLSQNMGIDSLFLRFSFKKASEIYNVNAKDSNRVYFPVSNFRGIQKGNSSVWSRCVLKRGLYNRDTHINHRLKQRLEP